VKTVGMECARNPVLLVWEAIRQPDLEGTINLVDMGDCMKDLYYFPSHVECQHVFQGYHKEYSLATAEIHDKGVHGA
jgi:hypothetical protein